ncbi:hypothetical protein RF11_07973 [Thelohanellus kitauei]|uniref:Uncharacterized protein n=1 Tax=Thelohanellus kitauei TaxID=669202 RepID=A0A0C2J1L9_THEKT|nr:hypothetical protein RF11_07973 [Thelohanellus kitauei]
MTLYGHLSWPDEADSNKHDIHILPLPLGARLFLASPFDAPSPELTESLENEGMNSFPSRYAYEWELIISRRGTARFVPQLLGGYVVVEYFPFVETCSSLVVARSRVVCDFIAPPRTRPFDSPAPAPENFRTRIPISVPHFRIGWGSTKLPTKTALKPELLQPQVNETWPYRRK